MSRHQQEYLANLIATFGCGILSGVTNSFWWSVVYGIAAVFFFASSMMHYAKIEVKP